MTILKEVALWDVDADAAAAKRNKLIKINKGARK